MKKLWNSIKTILYSYLVQYVLMIALIILFVIAFGNRINLNNMNRMYEISILGVAITSIPIGLYLYKKYNVKGDKIDVIKLLLMIPLGMCISLFYNMLIINFMHDELMDVNKILLYSYVVLIGPVFEEILFRYVGVNAAKKEYSSKKAVIIISILFALFHSGIFNMIYAFLIGIVLSYIYLKYRNIIYPIILHISANMMSVCITEFNINSLIISAIGILLICLYLRKIEHV